MVGSFWRHHGHSCLHTNRIARHTPLTSTRVPGKRCSILCIIWQVTTLLAFFLGHFLTTWFPWISHSHYPPILCKTCVEVPSTLFFLPHVRRV